MIVFGLMVMVSPVVADGDEDDGSQSTTSMSSSGGATGTSSSTQVEGNPWNCIGSSDRPHESRDDPGTGWINAKSHIQCTAPPPAGSHWHMIQILYRSSYVGWVFEDVKFSSCPSGAGEPRCRQRDMRAVLSWSCLPGVTYYNYRLETTHQLVVGDDIYTANTSNQSGESDEEGTVRCTNN